MAAIFIFCCKSSQRHSPNAGSVIQPREQVLLGELYPGEREVDGVDEATKASERCFKACFHRHSFPEVVN